MVADTRTPYDALSRESVRRCRAWRTDFADGLTTVLRADCDVISFGLLRHRTPAAAASAARDGASASLRANALHWEVRGRAIVKNVSLVVSPGEIVGLLGPNGAGKTVSLSMMAGLLHPTSGSVFLDGVDVTSFPLYERARRRLGYLPQERSVFTKLSARDNIAAILQANGKRRRDVRARTDALIAQFDLTRVQRSRAIRLSGGEQRRLEIARCLAIEPRYLLFDEPFAGIDPLTIAALRAIMLDQREHGIGILITDHNVQETLTLCDRVYVIFAGEVLACGAPSDIIADSRVRQHFLGKDFALAGGLPTPGTQTSPVVLSTV